MRPPLSFILCSLALTSTKVSAQKADSAKQCAANEQGESTCDSSSSSSTSFLQFVQERIFGQCDISAQSEDPFGQIVGDQDEGDQNEDDNFFEKIVSFFSSATKEDDLNERIMAQFLQASSPSQKQSLQEMWNMFTYATKEVQRQLETTFGHIPLLERFNILQLYYFMQYEESIKNPVWKRRQHRYQTRLPVKEAKQLGDGLYLSQLAYVDSCETVQTTLQQFSQNSWVLRNCTTTSQPNQPAHFLAVRRVAKPLKQPFGNLFQKPKSYIEVALVVRGTKGISDLLSDGMLQATDYRGGRAHDGILKSALWLVETYRDDLKHLLEWSRRSQMKLWLLGHSLGAGTAALAAMEFHETESSWIQAHALGFGTPSLVSPDMSIKYKERVTTIINDADAVPRMSGAVLANAWLRIIAYNWTQTALEDYDRFVSQAHTIIGNAWVSDVGNQFRTWLLNQFQENVFPWFENLPKATTGEAELIPPGECIHIYRDGVSWQGTYTNCSFFGELEVVRNFLDDHLIPSGYYNGLLNFVRDQEKNVSWHFDHDLLELPVV